ncbi:LOW QUALITY PROTEIN: ornithine decarboxylase antizyme-like [Topomyia yanbarensis]|uniref:LOW QUALITY PROTEIN: ornithine decarboxylase antizyme-like n=1 Tax=Topomyia yanbarensis TaxID=2498891 RepID=UPI00273B2F6A|nr:LOW QUALITY PROTEIN: ornithine decarboxylase antizyme-like [Topomyia yanbarensis]
MQNHNICRLCLGKSEDLENLYQPLDESTWLLDEIQDCVGIRITLAPGLPGQICAFCKVQVLTMSNFRKMCVSSDECLRREYADIYKEAELSSAFSLISCHENESEDATLLLGQRVKHDPSMSLGTCSSQESLDFGHYPLLEEALGDSVRDYNVEEVCTTVSRETTLTWDAPYESSSIVSVEPSISSSNRACKRTISSSSSSSSSSAGFDSFCVSLAVGPLWWSDVPTNRTDHDRASPLKDYNRKTSIDSTTTASSEYTDLDCTESTVDFMNQHEAAVIQEVLTQPTPTQITLKLYITAQKHSTWETIFNPLDNMLYVNLPSAMSHEASKHSFISLLEFAEEKLECDGVVLCIRKNRLDRPNLVRTFSFVGFQLVSPKSPLTPPHIEMQQKNEYLFMIYNIEE